MSPFLSRRPGDARRKQEAGSRKEPRKAHYVIDYRRAHGIDQVDSKLKYKNYDEK